jgi:hypothetical protein
MDANDVIIIIQYVSTLLFYAVFNIYLFIILLQHSLIILVNRTKTEMLQ